METSSIYVAFLLCQSVILKASCDNFSKVFSNIEFKFITFDKNVEKGHVTKMWNIVFKVAYDENCDYFYQCGDDVEFKTKDWVNDSIAMLKANNNIAFVPTMGNLHNGHLSLVEKAKSLSSDILVSIFINPEAKFFEPAKLTGTDRVELYTEPYALGYPLDREKAVQPYVEVAKLATELGLGLNAGHDLDLHNLAYLKQQIPQLLEVSIGHALICDALYYGLENTIQLYRRQLEL